MPPARASFATPPQELAVPFSPATTAAALRDCTTPAAARDLLAGLTVAQLREVHAVLGPEVIVTGRRKDDIVTDLVDAVIGHRHRAARLSVGGWADAEERAEIARTTIEARIRVAYTNTRQRPGVRGQPGSFVSLATLRPLLADIPRDALDDALDYMITLPDVWFLGEENQKVLSNADRAAAVEIGGELKFYLAIGA